MSINYLIFLYIKKAQVGDYTSRFYSCLVTELYATKKYLIVSIRVGLS